MNREIANRQGRNRSGRRVVALLLTAVLALTLGTYSLARTIAAGGSGGDPIREIHKVAVGDKTYCFFVTHNVVLTPEEVSKLADNDDLTNEILKRAGLYMREANCNDASHNDITAAEWVKNGGSFVLSDSDIAAIRNAAPSDGSPVKLHMDLRVSTDPANKDKDKTDGSGEDTDEGKDDSGKDTDEGKDDSGKDADEGKDDSGKDADAGTGDKGKTDDAKDGDSADDSSESGDSKSDADADNAASGDETKDGGAAEEEDKDKNTGDASADQDKKNDSAAEEGKSDNKSGEETGEEGKTDNTGEEGKTDNTGDESGDNQGEDPGDNQGDEPGDNPQEDKPSRVLYSTFKRTSPELLFVVIASKSDAAHGEDLCKEISPEPVTPSNPEPASPEPATPGGPETEEMLPELRTINMPARPGKPLEDTLKDGDPVTLEWIEPKDRPSTGDDDSFLKKFPGGAAGLVLLGGAAAAAAAAAVIIVRRKRESD